MEISGYICGAGSELARNLQRCAVAFYAKNGNVHGFVGLSEQLELSSSAFEIHTPISIILHTPH